MKGNIREIMKLTVLGVLCILLVGLIFPNKTVGASTPTSVKVIEIKKDSIPESDTIHIDRATRYNPTPEQCDASPFNTADGTYINPTALANKEIRWCALSWDLMDDAYRREVRNESWAWRGDIKFGDTIEIRSESKPFINGRYVVHDVMNGRYRKSIDILTHQSNMYPRLGVCKDMIIIHKAD